MVHLIKNISILEINKVILVLRKIFRILVYLKFKNKFRDNKTENSYSL